MLIRSDLQTLHCGLFKTVEEDKNVPEGEADLTSLV